MNYTDRSYLSARWSEFGTVLVTAVHTNVCDEGGPTPFRPTKHTACMLLTSAPPSSKIVGHGLCWMSKHPVFCLLSSAMSCWLPLQVGGRCCCPRRGAAAESGAGPEQASRRRMSAAIVVKQRGC